MYITWLYYIILYHGDSSEYWENIRHECTLPRKWLRRTSLEREREPLQLWDPLPVVGGEQAGSPRKRERRAQEHVWPLTNACRSIFSLLLQAMAAAEFPSLGYWGTAFSLKVGGGPPGGGEGGFGGTTELGCTAHPQKKVYASCGTGSPLKKWRTSFLEAWKNWWDAFLVLGNLRGHEIYVVFL